MTQRHAESPSRRPTAPTVGIVTLVDMQNYGNRLQNAAIHQLLADRGYNPTTIEICSSSGRARLRDTLYRAGVKDFLTSRRLRGRYRRSWQFAARHTPHLPVNETDVHSLVTRFDLFTIGSDQVWNPNDRRLGARSSGVQCLASVPADRKIAISPSFGVSDLTPNWRDRFAEWLPTFARLSVREQAGADLIASITGQPAEVLIDPTMAIPRERWQAMSSDRLNPRSPYLLQLFLGAVPSDREQRLARFADSAGLKVVNLSDPNDPVARRAGPAEFLSLISNAAAIVTDSFHCSVFAFLLDRPLMIFDRVGRGAAMSSRIATFASTFDVADRIVADEPQPIPHGLLAHDYAVGTKRLADERVRFAVFLDAELRRVAKSDPS